MSCPEVELEALRADGFTRQTSVGWLVAETGVRCVAAGKPASESDVLGGHFMRSGGPVGGRPA